MPKKTTNKSKKTVNSKKTGQKNTRKNQRQQRRETRQEKRADKREERQEQRAARKQDRQEKRENKQEQRAERKEERQQRRQERREARERFFARAARLEVRLFPTASNRFRFPESNDPELRARKNLGVAFSGGGTRSASHSIGQLRALLAMDLIKDIRYFGSNSGGTWAVLPFVYLPQSNISDNAYLGRHVAPGAMSRARMNSSDNMGIAGQQLCQADLILQMLAEAHATKNRGAAKALRLPFSNIKLGNDEVDEVYGRIIGRLFLEPVGLGGDRYVAWNWNQVDDFLRRNTRILPRANLTREDFVTVERSRPYPCVSATMNQDYFEFEDDDDGEFALLNIFEWEHVEFTPRYSGIHRHSRGKVNLNIGGGYVENPGWDTLLPFPSNGGRSMKVVTGKTMHRLTLADIMGTSGAAPAYLVQYIVDAARMAKAATNVATLVLPGIGKVVAHGVFRAVSKTSKVLNDYFDIFPRFRNWPVQHGGLKPLTVERGFGDGGYVDSFGLIPLLKRGVRNIIVMVNTDVPIQTGKAGYPDGIKLDSTFYGLFGVPMPEAEKNMTNPGAFIGEKGRVFQEDFSATAQDLALTAELAELGTDDGRPIRGYVNERTHGRLNGDGNERFIGKIHGVAYSRRSYKVLPNEFYGIRGGFRTRILWVYTTPSAAWRQELHADAANYLHSRSDENEVESVFNRFPHLPTFMTGHPDNLRQTIRDNFRNFGPLEGAQRTVRDIELIDIDPVHFNLMANYSCWALRKLEPEVNALSE